MAHKKAGGSTRNGRDSKGQRRSVKRYAGQDVGGGEIIVRQCGTKFFPGDNAGMGRDYTIYSKVPGRVVYSKTGKRTIISIEAA